MGTKQNISACSKLNFGVPLFYKSLSLQGIKIAIFTGNMFDCHVSGVEKINRRNSTVFSGL